MAISWHYYRFCDLLIRSAFPLPALIGCREGGCADVEITRGDVYEVNDAAHSDWAVMRIEVPGGQVFVSEGHTIRVAAPAELCEACLQQYTLGPGLGMLCHQRNLLPLHASAVQFGNGCVAFVGPSGVGKSTMAAMLALSGCGIMADDMCVLQVSTASEYVFALPTVRSLRLREDVAWNLCGERWGDSLRPDAFGKFSLTPHNEPISRPVPLISLCVLMPTPTPGAIRLDPLDGFDAFRAVIESVHWSGADEHAEYLEQIIRLSAATSNFVPVCRLTLPRGYDRLDELVNHLSAIPDFSKRCPLTF